MKPRYRTVKRSQGHKPGEMNGLERAYGERLALLKAGGEIHDFKFEAVKLRLADTTFYTADWAVWNNECVLELHECKAMTGSGDVLMDPVSNVKIKVAAEQYPQFTFKVAARATKKNGWGWTIKEVGG